MRRIVKKCDKCGRIGVYDENATIHGANGCNGNAIECNISCEDLYVIEDISNDDSFIDAMIALKEKDPIEYQLKMSQFKTQLAQQKNIQQQQFERSHVRLRCPYCNSDNVRRITAIEQVTSLSLLGMYSREFNKSFQCSNCGGTF